MKKKLFSAILIVLAVVALPAAAQMMPGGGFAGGQSSDTAREEAEGGVIWGKLQAGSVRCENLSNEDYELLGEYFMGQWAGSSHAAMNRMMVRMMGKSGEEQMHIALGKRQSGCDLNAGFPAGSFGFMPMMGMMQNFGGGESGFIASLIFTLLLWLLVIAGICMLVVWLVRSRGNAQDNVTLELLKERYARGEISREDFEKMKKDLQ